MTKLIQNKSITMIIAITATIALLGLSSVFITNQEALAEQRERPEIPTRGWGGVSAQVDTIDCVLNRNIPEDPLRVNIMPTVKGFHTVIMEKEIFDCVFTPEMGEPTPVIFQDTLLIQFNENKVGKQLGSIKIELVSCNKSLEFAEFGSACINLGTPPTNIGFLDCSDDAGNTEAFVDMDSASFNWLQKFAKDKVTYKTVIVEKEILDCIDLLTGASVIAEVFTIEEKVNGNVKFFKWVVCEKDPLFGIFACVASDTPLPT